MASSPHCFCTSALQACVVQVSSYDSLASVRSLGPAFLMKVGIIYCVLMSKSYRLIFKTAISLSEVKIVILV